MCTYQGLTFPPPQNRFKIFLVLATPSRNGKRKQVHCTKTASGVALLTPFVLIEHALVY